RSGFFLTGAPRRRQPFCCVRHLADTRWVLASEHFGVEQSGKDEWFDTILDVDTELFVDPFLVFKETDGFWADAHDLLIAHFNRAFMLVAEGNCDPNTLAYRKALRLLAFKEPR